MRISAGVWGFGPFSKSLVHLLPFDEAVYSGVKQKSIVSGMIGEVTEEETELLAEVLGIDIESMAWEVNAEWIDNHLLSKLQLEMGNGSVCAVAEAVMELLDNKWRLFFFKSEMEV